MTVVAPEFLSVTPLMNPSATQSSDVRKLIVETLPIQASAVQITANFEACKKRARTV